MLNISSNARTAIAGNGRTFKARITVNGSTLDSVIKKITFTYGSCGANTFSFGSVFISYADIVLSESGIVLADQEMLIEVGVVLPNGDVEYVPMGLFKAGVSDIKKERNKVSIKASDRLSTTASYLPTIKFPATIREVLDDIERQTGLTIKTSLDAVGKIIKPIEGTVVSVLSVIAGLLGGFCYCDRSGNVVIAAHPTVTSTTIYEERCLNHVQANEDKYSIDSLTVIASAGGEDALGDEVEEISFSDGFGLGIAVENAYMTQELFNSMKDRIIGYSFDSCTAKFMGDPTIEPCDAVNVIDYKGTELFVPCMSLVHEFDGGFTTEISTPSKSSSSSSAKGPLQQAVENLKINLLTVEKLLAKKIVAERIDVEGLFAKEIVAKAMTITGMSKFISESTDSKVIIDKGQVSVENTLDLIGGSTEIDYLQKILLDYEGLVLSGEKLNESLEEAEIAYLTPRIALKVDGELIGQLSNYGLTGVGNKANFYRLSGICDLSELRVANYFPYNVIDIAISNDDGDGYSIKRMSSECRTQYNPFVRMVSVNERVQITTSENITAGTSILVGTINLEEYRPESRVSASVYSDTNDSRMYSGTIGANGEIYVRPSTDMEAGRVYTLYISTSYFLGEVTGVIDSGTTQKILIEDQSTYIRVRVNEYTSCYVTAVSVIGSKLYYTWQQSLDGGVTWSNDISDNINNSVLEIMSVVGRTRLYRCAITDDEGNLVYSDPVTVDIYKPNTYKVMYNLEHCSSSNNATEVLEGDSYETVLTVNEGCEETGFLVKMISTDGVTNEDITLKVSDQKRPLNVLIEKITGDVTILYKAKPYIEIVRQPESVSVELGKTVTLSVEAVSCNNLELSYQWQVLQSAETNSWGDVINGTGSILKNVARDRVGTAQYRCKISDTEGRVAYTNIVVLTTYDPNDINYLLDENGDYLLDENNNRLTE